MSPILVTFTSRCDSYFERSKISFKENKQDLCSNGLDFCARKNEGKILWFSADCNVAIPFAEKGCFVECFAWCFENGKFQPKPKLVVLFKCSPAIITSISASLLSSMLLKKRFTSPTMQSVKEKKCCLK